MGNLIANNSDEVKTWFEGHPDAVKVVEDFDFQQYLPYSGHGDTHDEIYRKATIDDVKYISQNGWYEEAGVFGWLYPCGVPTYIMLQEPEPIHFPDDREYHSPETFAQMKERHEQELKDARHDADDWTAVIPVYSRQDKEKLAAMWDSDFAYKAFVSDMFNFEYAYSMDDEEILGHFGRVSSSDVERCIAELGLPERIVGVYKKAAKYVIDNCC